MCHNLCGAAAIWAPGVYSPADRRSV